MNKLNKSNPAVGKLIVMCAAVCTFFVFTATVSEAATSTATTTTVVADTHSTSTPPTAPETTASSSITTTSSSSTPTIPAATTTTVTTDDKEIESDQAISSNALMLGDATSPCGSIIEDGSATPIENCDNPFGVTPGDSPVTLSILGQEINDGATVLIPGTTTNQFQIMWSGPYYSFRVEAYRHVSEGYELVDLSAIEPEDLTEAEMNAALEEYFAGDPDIELYRQALQTGDVSHLTQEQDDAYYDFEIQLFDREPTRPHMPIGTYTFVFYEETICVMSDDASTFFARLRNWFVPTAHAQFSCPPGDEVYSVTFTLEQVPEEPAGPSSVLFLPGIQASRLYKDGILGIEDQIWTPTNAYSQDVGQLALDSNGQSVHDVYTRDVLDSAPGAGSVYGGFLKHLNDLKTNNVISDYRAFAYDWRFTPDSVVQNGTAYEQGIVDLVAVFEDLAEKASNDKVVIIGHSNGGLVAKALVAELENRNKSHLVDQIVFIGTPHIGTPKAIGTVLHGYDQSANFRGVPIIQARVAREVINNMPGAYGLLPTPTYMSLLSQPLITIENASSTAELYAAYGSTIDDYQDFVTFLSGEDALDRSLGQPISVPATINSDLYQQAVTEHTELLDAWQAPDGINVIQVVGVGLPTMAAVEYRQIEQEKCLPTGPGGGVVCGVNKLLKPFAQLSRDGDETVMSMSAAAYAGASDTYFVDMEEVEESDIFQVRHYNLTEAIEVQQLVTDVLLATTSAYSYVSTSKPTINTEYDLEIIDSPVRPYTTDSSGNVTGLVIENGTTTIKTDIPGSYYFSLGETKYLVIPSAVERTTTLVGEGSGGYTLTLATLNTDNEQEIQAMLQNASVTPSMRATYQKTNTGYSNIATDLDGDGSVDLVTTVTGEIIEQPTDTVTFADLKQAVSSLGLRNYQKTFLMQLIDRADYYAQAAEYNRWYSKVAKKYLRITDSIVRWYQKLGYVDREERKEIQKIIKALKKNV